MRRLLVRKLLHLVPVLFLITLAATALVDLLPGSPGAAILGPGATLEEIADYDARFGFDQPLPVRYVEWLGGVATGDLGTSARTGESVAGTILQRMPVTLEIAVLALALSVVMAIPLAVLSAAKANGPLDRFLTGGASLLMSVPSFVAAMLLLFFASYRFGWFPTSGWSALSDGVWQNLRYAALPAVSLAIVEAPVFQRILRSDVISTLQEEYVLAARSKGLTRRYVLFRHALRPSLFSVTTVAGLALGRLIGGSIVIEFLFALPGIGNLVVQSIHQQDIPMVQGLVMFIALSYILVNTAVDIGYSLIDPRVRVA